MWTRPDTVNSNFKCGCIKFLAVSCLYMMCWLVDSRPLSSPFLSFWVFLLSACPSVAAPLKGMSQFLLQLSITNDGQNLLGNSYNHARMQNFDMAWPLQCWTHSNYFLITVPWYADLKQMRDTLSAVFFSYVKMRICCLSIIFISLLFSFLVSWISSFLNTHEKEWMIGSENICPHPSLGPALALCYSMVPRIQCT